MRPTHRLIGLIAAIGVTAMTPQVHAEDEETPLALEMEEMSRALKNLRRLRKDPDRWTKSAAAIRTGAEHCIKAMPMVPKEIEAMPDGLAKKKALADSRRMMGLALALYAELELAFLAEDEEKAEEIIEKIKELKVESHEKYNKGE